MDSDSTLVTGDVNDQEQQLIDRVYAQCALAAREQGLQGLVATRAVYAAVAKLASRNLGRTFTAEDIRRLRED